MRIHEHLDKANRIERSRTRLDPDADYVLYVETFMLAMTHRLNALLHSLSMTPESLDLIHTYLPRLERAFSQDVERALGLVREIEAMRPGYLRGDAPWSNLDTARCVESERALKHVFAVCMNAQ